MPELGYALSTEEHRPLDLVRYAQQAEEAGFTYALISDHFHPWVDRQGQSPFVWSVIGGIAHATNRLRLGTGVTAPIIRIHPAIIAQAAATSAAMMPGRFFLGVGTGENLNEHVIGAGWPEYDIRSEMLEEAIEIIRMLWEGEGISHYGMYYTVENARLYTLPDELPPIYVAAGGSKSAQLAGRIGDGLISTAPKGEIVDTFESTGGGDKPRYGQLTVCWAEDEDEALEMAYEIWPNAGIHGQLSQELPTPTLFEQATKLVRKEDVAEAVICGPDANRHIEAIEKYTDAGYDHVYVHQIGPNQEGFFRFYQREIMPEFQ